MTNHRLIATVVGAASFGVGVFAGYKVAERRLGEQFEKRLEEETRGMKEFYTQTPTQKYSTPEEAVADLVVAEAAKVAITEYQGGEKVAYHKIVKSEVQPDTDQVVERVAEVVEETMTNVFDRRQNPDQPYMISQENYMQGVSTYNQVTLTYYEVDDKLTDERDDLIDEVESTVGLDWKVNFGWESSDENTVHVRNEKLRMDFEIVKDERSYQSQVLGEEDPIEPPIEKISARMRRERQMGHDR